MKRLLLVFISILVCQCAIGQPAAPQIDASWFKENYTKAEWMIPMRDGVKLYTAVFVPKNKRTTHPVLMTRTPYGCVPYGKKDASFWEKSIYEPYLRAEYILVFQDVRGRWLSEGEFVNVRPYIENKTARDVDESSDTYDTIEWLLRKLKTDNGNVGIYGNSYSGFYALMGAASHHPAIKAVSPQAPICDWFVGDDIHHNGALALMDVVSFLPHLAPTQRTKASEELPAFEPIVQGDVWNYFMQNRIPDITRQFAGRVDFWQDIISHPNYDEWWQQRDARRATKDISAAMLMVGGTYDAEDPMGVWELYRSLKNNNPRLDCRLVVGPWAHGAWRSNGDANTLGDVEFSQESLSRFYRDEVEFPFFDKYLRGEGDGGASATGALVFFSGENCWREMEQWSSDSNKEVKLYFGEDFSLRQEPLTQQESYSEYISDPNNPVPYYHDISSLRKNEYMVADQGFVQERDDVLTFLSPVLESDMTLAGAIDAELFVSLSQSDADFVVKVIDVGPDAEYEMMVRANIMRGRYRNSLSSPQPLEPDKVERIALQLPDVAHTFMAGHRIKIQIQSSMFPLFDMNPQQYIDIYKADKSDFLPCTVRLHHSAEYPSNVTLRVME